MRARKRSSQKRKEEEDVPKVRARRSPTFRHFVTGTIFVLVLSLVFFYWAAFPLLNSIFFHGYPKFAIPPSPNTFQTSRYGQDWWLVWTLTLFGLLPFTLMMAIRENRIQEYALLHANLSWILAVVYFFVFLWMWLIRSLWLCNTYSSAGNTVCNDYRACGVFYNSTSTAWLSWCPNVTPFTPPVAISDLHINEEQKQNIIFAAIFSALSGANWFMNKHLTQLGIFSNSPAPEDYE